MILWIKDITHWIRAWCKYNHSLISEDKGGTTSHKMNLNFSWRHRMLHKHNNEEVLVTQVQIFKNQKSQKILHLNKQIQEQHINSLYFRKIDKKYYKIRLRLLKLYNRIHKDTNTKLEYLEDFPTRTAEIYLSMGRQSWIEIVPNKI